MIDVGADLQRAYDDGYAHGIADAMKWIPCSERLPEHPQPNTDFDGKPLAVYLVCRKGYIPFSVFWNGDFFTDDLTPIDVDAWMPLPEPYKEDDDGTR